MRTSQNVWCSTEEIDEFSREGERDRTDELVVVSDKNPPMMSGQCGSDEDGLQGLGTAGMLVCDEGYRGVFLCGGAPDLCLYRRCRPRPIGFEGARKEVFSEGMCFSWRVIVVCIFQLYAVTFRRRMK